MSGGPVGSRETALSPGLHSGDSKKVETYEVVETIKHEETNPYSLAAFTECNVIITQSALLGGDALWWKAGPWHFGGSLAMGGFSHHLRCYKTCG